MSAARLAAEVVVALDDGEVDQLLVDDGAARASGDPLGFVAAVVAAAGGTPVTLLWPVAAEAERAALLALGVTRVVAKPTAGAALVKVLYPPDTVNLSDPLVSQAA